jgi:hypothetical protein
MISMHLVHQNVLPDEAVIESIYFRSKSKLYYDRQSVGKSVLVSGNHLGLATNFSHSLSDYFLDSCGFVDVGRPL